ncbi:hypothetical protein CULT_200022 [[Clostridium] ultunense Esp]|nr:hypothetical protein CULT_200022 [[Clostridium] ultunense Esp]
MENGLYEKLIDIEAKEKIDLKEYKETRNVDNSELSRVLSTTYQKIINESLSQMTSEKEKAEYIESLNKTIGIGGFDYSNNKFK